LKDIEEATNGTNCTVSALRSRAGASFGSAFLPWLLLAPPGIACAQQADGAYAAVAATAGDLAPGAAGRALLADALDCRVDDAQLPVLLPRLRKEQPADFVQPERQYSAPDMDLYRLGEPVAAWGYESDAIVVTANRVMLAVAGPDDEIGRQVDVYLERSSDSPRSGLLDARHALVVYPAQRPGLEGMTLVGCEYHVDGLSLLDDPDDAWRKQPLPSPGLPSASPSVAANPAIVRP
jgi:hypothetical protein